MAVLATLGLLICIGMFVRKRLRCCGTYEPAEIPPARPGGAEAGRRPNYQDKQVAAATDVETHLPPTIVHYSNKTADSVVPEIQVIQPRVQSTNSVLEGRISTGFRRRKSI